MRRVSAFLVVFGMLVTAAVALQATAQDGFVCAVAGDEEGAGEFEQAGAGLVERHAGVFSGEIHHAVGRFAGAGVDEGAVAVLAFFADDDLAAFNVRRRSEAAAGFAHSLGEAVERRDAQRPALKNRPACVGVVAG